MYSRRIQSWRPRGKKRFALRCILNGGRILSIHKSRMNWLVSGFFYHISRRNMELYFSQVKATFDYECFLGKLTVRQNSIALYFLAFAHWVRLCVSTSAAFPTRENWAVNLGLWEWDVNAWDEFSHRSSWVDIWRRNTREYIKSELSLEIAACTEGLCHSFLWGDLEYSWHSVMSLGCEYESYVLAFLIPKGIKIPLIKWLRDI